MYVKRKMLRMLNEETSQTDAREITQLQNVERKIKKYARTLNVDNHTPILQCTTHNDLPPT